MGLWDTVTRFFALEGVGPDIQSRTIGETFPTLEQQLAALRGQNGTRPWRPASIDDALGVPAIYRAASLIANTVGMLSMNGYKDEVRMPPQDRPRLIVRPNPKTTARRFYRDTAWSLATRGESWWYTAHRDSDGNADALIVVPPKEIRLDPNPNDRFNPVIHWMPRPDGTDIWPNRDFRQLTLDQDSGDLRGIGPLQACGAAVSVAVESQEWAANFFAAGGYPSYWVKYIGDLSGGKDEWGTEDADTVDTSEVERFKAQWIAAAPNTPRVTDSSIDDIKQFDVNPQGAQMLDARNYNKGDAANMFGIPGPLLSYSQPGSALTYQNIGDLFLEFVRTCLRPNYLEEIDQTMSDLLTRNIVARMNTEPVEQADTKGRYETWKLGIEAGIIDVEYAQAKEGILPGDVENAPVPFSPPGSIVQIPMARTAEPFRCAGKYTRFLRSEGGARLVPCNKLTAPGYVGTCPRCGEVYTAA